MEGKGKKRNRVILIIIAFLFSFQGSAFADSCYCLKKLEERYTHLNGLVLIYDRYIISSTMAMLGEAKQTDLAKGKIFLKPPCYIRIDQKEPEHESVLCDGKWIWWYIPEKRIVHKYSPESFAKEISILTSIFNGIKDIKKDFIISPQGKFTFVLKPNKNWQDIDRIEISADKTCHRITEVKIYNLLGSITCFKIKKEVSKDINDNLFTFIPPPGVKIIQEK